MSMRFAEVRLLLSLVYLTLIVKCQNDECLQTNNANNLPTFMGSRGPAGERIEHQHQAIVTTYKFNCCGNITEWGVDLNPVEDNLYFNFDFQVWRPSSTVNETGCYSLVGNYAATSISIETSVTESHVARVTPSYQLQFQPGDVLGFYVESEAEMTPEDNGVVLLHSGAFTSENVWHTSITSRSSQSGSCPYPIGTDGVLNTLTRAAPVISISTLVYSCPQSFGPVVLTSQNSNPLSVTHSMSVMPIETTVTPDVTSNNAPLIAGAVIAILVVCALLATLIVIVVVVKKRRVNGKVVGQAFANQIYDEPQGSSAPRPVKYSTKSPYPGAVAMDYLHKENPGSNKMPAQIQAEFYHTVGPSASNNAMPGPPLHVGDDVYQYAEDAWEGEAAGSQEAQPYEVPNGVDVFTKTGVYVPTEDERTNWESHYETYYASSNDVYSKTEFFVEEQIYWAPAHTTYGIYSQLASKKYREIPRDQIRTTGALGSGEFGDVCKALWSISGATKEMAVKTLKPGALENDRVRFLQEAAIMGQFNHPNVVKLYGVVTVDDPIMICIELLSRGDLRGYLLSLHPLKHTVIEIESQLLKFSRQTASGMAYLSKKSFVHRDLAARNILLDNSLNCKIGDFGMARDLEDDTYYTVHSKENKIPVKWTAPEALMYRKYSSDSDVWSYGMVLFEIWSVGRKPFSDMTNQQVMKKINSGYCQPPPPGCPRAIYKLMVSCWNPLHAKRPPFSKISSTLTSSTSEVLAWRSGDRHLAGQLGGQLSEAKYLYVDLQNTYLQNKHHY